MGIVTEYLQQQIEAEKKYGDRTVVLIQVGVFYEMYEYDPTYCLNEEVKKDKEGKLWLDHIGHAVELSVILNSILTCENNHEAYGINNPHKVGFPVIAYEKNKATLLANEYVIVRLDQAKNGTEITRFIAEVCNPTMQMDNIALNKTTSNILCIYIEYQANRSNKFENMLITAGVAVIDILTGTNRVAEFYSKEDDEIFAIQELYRFLIAHYPRELIIHIEDMPKEYVSKEFLDKNSTSKEYVSKEFLDKNSTSKEYVSKEFQNPENNPYVKYLEKVLELRRFERLIININQLSKEYKKIPYQIEFFNKIFNTVTNKSGIKTGLKLNILQKTNDHIIQDLGLESMNYGRLAYLALVQYCFSHNAAIISHLSKPDSHWIDDNKHLILTHNAIIQLDLISKDNASPKDNKSLKKQTEIDSLMSIIDFTATHLGRRALYNILQNPMSKAEDIEISYNMVEEMLNIKVETESLWLILDRLLKELPDIARLQRKLEIKILTPKDLAVLYHAYSKIVNIYLILVKLTIPNIHSQLLPALEVENFNQFMSYFGKMFNFTALECCRIDTLESGEKIIEFVDNPIQIGIYPELDAIANNLSICEKQFLAIIEHLNSFLNGKQGQKLTYKTMKKKQGAKKQDPTGTVLTTTVAKAANLMKASVDQSLCGILQIHAYTSTEQIITSDKISALCTQIDMYKNAMRSQILLIYENLLNEMLSKYIFYNPLAALIGKLDLIHSFAKAAYTYNYYRPKMDYTKGASYLEAIDLRHPIIERIIDGKYIPNDIYLGQAVDMNNNTTGILLYGVNQTGKTSLGKAVALTIILAQIGSYVPCHLKYRPYSRIITRLTGNDNIFKGQSSFIIEMTELRTILRQANANTLVVGDELTKGTETISGTALTISTILSLIEKKTSFIFATHMHHLVEDPYILAIAKENLRICHLSISYEETTKDLIYDRKLKDGPGSPIYGLMVAKALNLPVTFIDKAMEISQSITGANKHFLEPKLSRYNKEVYLDRCMECQATNKVTKLHTHHIEEQSKADAKGMINNMHKNVKDNLTTLCETCHQKLHANKKELIVLQTSTGKILCTSEQE